MAIIGNQNLVTLKDSGLNATGSLNAFYDEVVFHEIAKGTNRFFVTFERGQFGSRNNQRESIGTCEIDYPHVTHQTGGLLDPTFDKKGNLVNRTRRSLTYRAFLDEEEVALNSSTNFQNNGHITMTQLKGDRGFSTYLTASVFKPQTLTYEVHADGQSSTSTRTVSCSYFWPHSQYQLSVLRNTATVVINLDKKNELPNGLGQRGFILIPDNTDQLVRDNLDYYLEKAGLIPKTTRDKQKIRPEQGGESEKVDLGKGILPKIGQGKSLNLITENNEDELDNIPLSKITDPKTFFFRLKKRNEEAKAAMEAKMKAMREEFERKANLFTQRLGQNVGAQGEFKRINVKNRRNIRKHNHPHDHGGKRGRKKSDHRHRD
mgnify:CR=1 FL=1